jgi:hypothetical protein
MDTNPHPNRPRRKRALSIACGSQSLTGSSEGNEERISLRVHLHTAVTRKYLPKQSPMLQEHVGVPVTELLHQLG